jgi:hypothetical protein
MSDEFDPFTEQDNFADAILATEEPDAWTLSELHDSADLGSLRSAWTSTNDATF